MKKKILSLGVILMLVVMLIALTGCRDNQQSTMNSQEDVVEKNEDKGAETISSFNKHIMNNDFKSACNLISIEKSNEYLEIAFSKSEYEDILENNLSNSLAHKIANIEKLDNKDEYNKTAYSNEVSYESYKEKFEKSSLYLVTFDAEGREFTDLYIVDENNNIITSGIMSYSFKSKYNFEQTNRTLTNNND